MRDYLGMDVDAGNPHLVAFDDVSLVPTCDDLTAITLGHLLVDLREKATLLDTLASRIGLEPSLAEHLQSHAAKLHETLDALACTHCERAAATEMSGLTGQLCAKCFTKEHA